MKTFWRQVAFHCGLDQRTSFLIISDESRLSTPIEIEKILSNSNFEVGRIPGVAKPSVYSHGAAEKQKSAHLLSSLVHWQTSSLVDICTPLFSFSGQTQSICQLLQLPSAKFSRNLGMDWQGFPSDWVDVEKVFINDLNKNTVGTNQIHGIFGSATKEGFFLEFSDGKLLFADDCRSLKPLSDRVLPMFSKELSFESRDKAGKLVTIASLGMVSYELNHVLDDEDQLNASSTLMISSPVFSYEVLCESIQQFFAMIRSRKDGLSITIHADNVTMQAALNLALIDLGRNFRKNLQIDNADFLRCFSVQSGFVKSMFFDDKQQDVWLGFDSSSNCLVAHSHGSVFSYKEGRF